MKKRILSIMLTLCMVLAFMPQMAFAAGTGGTYTVIDGTVGAAENEGSGSLIDGNPSTKWCVTDFKSAYIIFKTASAVNINGYSITTGNDNSSYFGRNPKAWTLYGSNEANPSKESTNWEVIDSIADDKVLEDKDNETYYFTLENTTGAYQYYKLEISATKGADTMQMSEFALIDCNHTWGTPTVTDPTCAERGYSTYECKICLAVVMKDFTNPLGHDFSGEDGKCTHCDKTKAELYTFDVSKGKVRIRDDENIDGKIKVLYGNGQSEKSEGNIDPDETITVTGSTNEYELHVSTARKVTIKVDNLRIDSSKGDNGKYAMLIEGSNNSADVTLILEGANTFKGGQDRSGISVGEGRKLTIEGSGSLNAQGGSAAAGIGGDVKSSGGTIIMNGGTVTANGGDSGGAGIGGGFCGSGGTIAINGGTVTANGGGAGIGGGFGGGSGGTFSTGTNGNAIIFAKSISDKSNQSSWSGVIFEGDNGAVYGTSVTPTENFTIESGKTLTIPAGVTLTNNSTITNNGTIYVDGALNGTPTNSGTVYYLLNVANASAAGATSEHDNKTYATAGSTITLTPDNPPAGKVFKKWVVSSNNVTVENNTFTMPNAAVTVTAQWRPIYYSTTQKPTIQDGEGVKATLSTDGTVATITVDDGYELTDVVLNGVSLGKVTEVKGLKTGDKLVVTAAKKAAEPTEPTKEEILAALADQKLAARSKLVTMKNGKKAVKITWYNQNGEMMGFDGVEIYRSTKRSSGYGKKPVFVIKSGKSSYYNTAIKSGTRYYYKVRGFVIIDGQKYYTDWSLKAIRTVK